MNHTGIITRLYASPYGALMLGAYGDALCMCDWLAGTAHPRVLGRLLNALGAETSGGMPPVIEAAMSQLDEYFAGTRRRFDLPLLFIGTPFQKRVWNRLAGIPYGTTISYGAMAASMGIPKAVRAVANANGANPLSIFAPCHRVIRSDGTLTGYGGGLETKKQLLELEHALLPPE